MQAGDGVLAYVREAGPDRIGVALNLTGRPRTIALSGTVRLSTRLDRQAEQAGDELRLRANEGVVLEDLP